MCQTKQSLQKQEKKNKLDRLVKDRQEKVDSKTKINKQL